MQNYAEEIAFDGTTCFCLCLLLKALVYLFLGFQLFLLLHAHPEGELPTSGSVIKQLLVGPCFENVMKCIMYSDKNERGILNVV